MASRCGGGLRLVYLVAAALRGRSTSSDAPLIMGTEMNPPHQRNEPPTMRTLPHDVAEARIDEFRQGCGAEPQEWVKEAIRSGEWDRRQAENLRNMRRSVQRLAQLKREGYSFDAEHRLVAPPNPIIPRCAASRSERPRERRARRSSSGSRGDPDPESEPPLGGVTDSRPSPRTCEVC